MKRASDGGLYGVSYGQGVFVANGGGRIVFSTDGETWTSRNTPSHFSGGGDIAYGKNTFVAVGLSEIIQSDPILTLGLTGAHVLSIHGIEERSYRIEAASNLNSTNGWQTLTTLTMTNSPALWRDEGVAGVNQRFYRAALVP